MEGRGLTPPPPDCWDACMVEGWGLLGSIHQSILCDSDAFVPSQTQLWSRFQFPWAERRLVVGGRLRTTPSPKLRQNWTFKFPNWSRHDAPFPYPIAFLSCQSPPIMKHKEELVSLSVLIPPFPLSKLVGSLHVSAKRSIQSGTNMPMLIQLSPGKQIRHEKIKSPNNTLALTFLPWLAFLFPKQFATPLVVPSHNHWSHYIICYGCHLQWVTA